MGVNMGKINKFLCEWADLDNKGYVTIGDFLKFSFISAILIGIVVIGLYSLYDYFSKGAMFATEIYPISSFYTLGGTIFTIICGFILIALILIAVSLFQVFLDIRIAECKLKGNINYDYSKEPLKAEKEGDI